MVLLSVLHFTTVFNLPKKFLKLYNEDSTHLIIQIILFLCLKRTNVIPATDKLLSVYHILNMLNIYVSEHIC